MDFLTFRIAEKLYFLKKDLERKNLPKREIRKLLENYARSLSTEVVDFRITETTDPVYFHRRASSVYDQWPVSWNVAVAQYTSGVCVDHFLILCYTPNEKHLDEIQSMIEYIPDYDGEDLDDLN